MKGFGKKLVAVLLAAVMVFGAAPLGGLAAIDIDLDFSPVFESKAFAEEYISGSFTYSLNEDGEAQITGSNNTGKVEIPSEIDGHTVVSIGYAAFRYDDVTEVVIPGTVTEICGDAFYYCDLLEKVTLNEGLVKIGSSAFYCCSGLTEIEIPDSVEIIDYQAFDDCRNLADVKLGKSVKTIGTRAFEGSSITEIKIPDSVTTIGYGAFEECALLESVDIGNSVERIEGYAFYSCPVLKSIDVPDSVVYIGDWAFYCCTALESVDLGKSVERIGSHAFCWCPSLKSIRIPDSVIRIENAAFYACEALESVDLGSSVEVIYEDAFAGCTALKSIEIPDSVVYIGNNAFAGCTALKSIEISDSVKEIGSNAFVGCTALESIEFGNGLERLYSYAFADCTSLRSVTIPAGIEEYGSGVFEDCTALEEVTFADGATYIGSEMFRNCTSLTKVNIPASIHGIDYTAFMGCTALAGLNIASESPNFVSDEKAVYNKNRTELVLFLDRDATSFEISSTVKVIGDGAFYKCSNLESVTIPEGVTFIGADAFYDCDALADVKLPSTLKVIDAYAFEDCSSLKSIAIPYGVTEIGDSAFAYTAIESITVPDTVSYLGSSVFYDCSALAQVTLPSGLTEIPYSAFYRCSSLESITIPASVKSIGSQAFAYCYSLKSIVIPDSVTEIGYEAFCCCTSLESVELGSGVTEIESDAFYCCTALKSIDLPDGLETIDSYAFFECSSLTEITIPASVKYVDSSAFSNCVNLASINIEGDITEFSYGVFYNTAHWNNAENWDGATNSYDEWEDTAIYYADGYVLDYNTYIKGSYSVREGTRAIGGNGFAGNQELTSISLPAGLKAIGNNSFHGCSALTSVSIPASVEYIGDYAFSNCTMLESINIPDNTTLGYRVFRYCENLKTITAGKNIKGLSIEDIEDTAFYNNSENWGDDVLYLGSVFLGTNTTLEGTFTLKEGTTTIAEKAFGDQENLTQVIIPDTVSYIGEYAFANCAALTSIDLPEALTYIGDYAFYGCSSIPSVEVPESVTEIGHYAFTLCSGLESAVLPDALTEVNEGMFTGCINLKTVNIPKNAEIICEAAFTACLALEKIDLPESVFYIDTGAFAGCIELKTIDLTNVKGVAEASFLACTSLEEVVIPAGLEIIYPFAFTAATSIKEFKVDPANPNFTADEYGALFSKDMRMLYEYPAASPATSYAIPEGVETMAIPFVSTVNLEHLHFPASLGDYDEMEAWVLATTALMKLDANSVVGALKGFVDPLMSILQTAANGTGEEGIVGLLNSALEFVIDYVNGIESKEQLSQEIVDFVTGLIDTVDNTALKSITVAEGNPWLYAEDGVLYAKVSGADTLICVPAAKTGDLKINSNVEFIAPVAFAFCDLGEIILPAKITELEDMMFALCKAEKIVIPETVKEVGQAPFAASSIGTIEFEGTELFESGNYSEMMFMFSLADEVILPADLEELPEGMFMLSGAKSVTLPKNIDRISELAFLGAFGLKEITIPDSVKEISDYAFAACLQLEKVNISTNSELERIGEGVFLGTQITEFYVPAAVSEIGMLALKPSLGGAISCVADILKIFMDEYKEQLEEVGLAIDYDKAAAALDNAVSWFNSGSTVTVDERNKNFVSENGVLYNAGKSVILHADETLSGAYEIPATVTEIGQAAFSFTNVTEVVIPDTVTSIGSGAFAICPKLEQVTIGAGVNTLDNVFGLCANLKRIVILPTVTTITDDAIFLCPNVTIAGFVESTAYEYAYEFEIPFEALDGEGYVSITAPTAVASEKVAVYGHTVANTLVEVYDGETKIAETVSGETGYWTFVVELVNPTEGSIHVLTAKINAGTEDEVCSSPVEVLYSRGTPTFESITLYHSYQARTITLETKNATSDSVTYSSGSPFTYEIKLSAYDGTKTLYVVSGKYKMPAVYDARNDVYVASGYFSNDIDYIPEYVSLELDGRTLSGTKFRFPFIIDPSGFVYEGVHSNRIEGATASIFFKDENGLAQLWTDAPLFGQLSSVVTGADGVFKWDVPSGEWQVKVEKEGYETAFSSWLLVPPPQLEVYIGLIAKDSPAVKYINGYTDGIDITFTQYMDTSTVNSETVTVTDSEGNVITGKWTAVDVEKSGSDEYTYLARTFTFTPDFTNSAAAALSGEYSIVVNASGATNYAGKTLAAHHSEKISVASRIETLNIPKTLSLEYMKDYSNTKENVITVDGTIAAAGKKVNISLSNDNYVEGMSSVILDENGRAEIAIVPTRPGDVKVIFSLDGTALSESVDVNVSMAKKTEVTGITVSDSSKEIIKGEEFRIYAYVAPDFATDKQVTWVSDNSSVATVDDNGLVTAVSEGTATITAVTVDGGFTADCVIKVYVPENHVNWVVDDKTTTVTAKVGEAIAKPADPVKEGYEFLGWTPEIPDVMPDNELTFTAVFKKNVYNVNWVVDGNTTTAAVKVGDAIAKPADPVKEGYVFTGWSPAIPDAMPESDLTFTAGFKKNVYNVNWVVDGNTTTVAVKVGEAIAKPADPVKEGYVFTGWSPAIPDAMPESDLTFTAGFERKALKLEIGAPSVTEIRYNDAIWLHLNVTEGELPEGATVEWTLSNGNFTKTEVASDGLKCLITAAANGNCVITVTVYDANGEEIASDTQEMTSKAGFFHKIIAFFLKLFRMLKVYDR